MTARNYIGFRVANVIMEKKMETTLLYRGNMWGYIRIMEKNMETTIYSSCQYPRAPNSPM